MPYLVDDQFWQLLEPLLPRPRRRYRHPGRKRLDDRRVLAGIVFVLTTGLAAFDALPADDYATLRRELDAVADPGATPRA